MADNVRTDQWRWKDSEHDSSRRNEVNRHDGNQDNAVIYRKKNGDQRHRRDKTKKRWSVRPDVNLVLVPRGKQCQIITAVVFIFLGLFLAVAGLVIIVILKSVSQIVWSVGIAMLVLGAVVLIVGLFYMLCKCCFRTSTRYKEYKAQFKAGGKYEMAEVSERSPEMKRSSPRAKSKMHDKHQELVGGYQSRMGDQPSDTTYRTYVTANEHTPSMPNLSSGRPRSTPQWITPEGYRPVEVNDLSDYTMAMQTADDHHFDHNGHNQVASSPDTTERSDLQDDFAKLEEALREMVMNKSGGGEMTHLMREPLDTSTPAHPKTQTHHRVHNVPIQLEGDRGAHTDGDHGVHRVPIVIEGDHRGSSPNPIPPSYDQVLRNYRTYSRSASPTRLMESDL
ncbi:uncharacterized protein LOC100889812 [Strongylocentrotus purpuratus]|uniref:Uncharacterized protein n=1 Tax=Strongylocentrotus purpuratus TaxID=7668 RepID=A0A7M7GJ44_STRPU|nr:uncharacterized protein LOC100889812 [Strongylocentrotus purpuratus]